MSILNNWSAFLDQHINTSGPKVNILTFVCGYKIPDKKIRLVFDNIDFNLILCFALEDDETGEGKGKQKQKKQRTTGKEKLYKSSFFFVVTQI